MLRNTTAMAALALCAAAAPAGAAATTAERTGYAYELGGNALLYTEQHEETLRNGRVTRSVVTYRDARGEVVATKRLDFSRKAISPDFRLENSRNGHVEGARRRGDRVLVYFRKTGDYEYRDERVEPPAGAIIDGGFDRFIEHQWRRLLAGEEFERPFLVPSMRRFVDFRIYLEGRSDADVVFVMEPASLLLRVVGGRITVVYDRESRALKRYEGVSNIRDRAGENYEVRVEFPAAGVRDASEASARAAPPFD